LIPLNAEVRKMSGRRRRSITIRDVSFSEMGKDPIKDMIETSSAGSSNWPNTLPDTDCDVPIVRFANRTASDACPTNIVRIIVSAVCVDMQAIRKYLLMYFLLDQFAIRSFHSSNNKSRTIG